MSHTVARLGGLATRSRLRTIRTACVVRLGGRDTSLAVDGLGERSQSGAGASRCMAFGHVELGSDSSSVLFGLSVRRHTRGARLLDGKRAGRSRGGDGDRRAAWDHNGTRAIGAGVAGAALELVGVV